MAIDAKKRCFGNHSELYAHYHDKEWGIPIHDDQHLFEILILEGAHAGLSWETVLKKRSSYRKQFFDFDIERVASMSDQELEQALQNPEIVRNRLKVYSTRKNAIIFQKIQQEFGSFDSYLWAYVGNKPQINHWQNSKDVPAHTPTSDKLSKDLKKRGMSFVGTTIMYAYMQAVGLVNDHIASCWKYNQRP